MKKQLQPFSPARAVMKLLCLMLALLLSAMMLITQFAYTQLSNLPHVGQIEGGSALHRMTDGGLNAFFQNLSGQSELIGGPGSPLINFLLIGKDSREGLPDARSDSMILCTVNRNTGVITLTSLLRDLYLPIPGHGSNRLNAAYTFGGQTLLAQTISESLGVYLNGTVEVDFVSFSQIVDRLGGVELELREDEAFLINEELGSRLQAGIQRLDGNQSLSFTRIRKLDADGDFSRTDRQRRVLLAIVSQLRGTDLRKLPAITNDLLPMIRTDLTGIEFLRYCVELFPLLNEAQIISQSVPEPGKCSDQVIDGMAVLVADGKLLRSQIRSSLLPEQTDPT